MSARTSARTPSLRSERDLQKIAATVLRLAKTHGIREAEVQIDESIEALTRFANNAIHQHVAEHGLVVSIRTVVDARTARVTTNRIDEDALRDAVQSAASLSAQQPKDSHLLPMLGKQKYRSVRRFHPGTAALSAEDRARAVRSACQLAEKQGQIAAGIFSSGQNHCLLANSRGLSAAHRKDALAITVRGLLVEHALARERSEHVLRDDEGPHVRVVHGAVPVQVPERRL